MTPVLALFPNRFRHFVLIVLLSIFSPLTAYPIPAESSQTPAPSKAGAVPNLPPNENALFLKVANLMRNDKEAALKQLLKSLNERHSAVLYFMTADLLQQNGYTKDALAYFHVAIKKQPDFRMALRSAGVIETHLKNYDGARKLLLRALDTAGRPDHITFGTLGHCYENLEDFESAESFYREAINLKPDYRGWKAGLARSLKGQSKHQEATALLETLGSRPSQ